MAEEKHSKMGLREREKFHHTSSSLPASAEGEGEWQFTVDTLYLIQSVLDFTLLEMTRVWFLFSLYDINFV